MKKVTDNPDYNAIPKMKYVEAPVSNPLEKPTTSSKGIAGLTMVVTTVLALAGAYYLIIEQAKTNPMSNEKNKNLKSSLYN